MDQHGAGDNIHPHYKVLREIPSFERGTSCYREAVLDSIRQRLLDNQHDNTVERLAITGLGGVGKSQVALQVAHWALHHKPEWSILWFPLSNAVSFEEACAKAARGLWPKDLNAKAAKRAVGDFLQDPRSGNWLLIFDDAQSEDFIFGADSEGGEIEEFLPASTRGRVLLTTRQRRLADRFAGDAVIGLGSMSKVESNALLQSSIVERRHLDSEEAVVELLNVLDNFPLAVILAAAYLNCSSLSIREYVDLLHEIKSDGQELLGPLMEDCGMTLSVALAWKVTFERLQNDPAALLLISFMAHIEPGAIPHSLLTKVDTEQPLTQGIKLLCEYAFLFERNNENVYDMHPVVHQGLCLWLMKQDDAVQRRQAALNHLQSLFRMSDWAEREIWRPCLPHVIRAINYSASDAKSHRHQLQHYGLVECQLGYAAGMRMLSEGQCSEPVALLEKVVAAQKELSPETDSALLLVQHGLARAYSANSQVKQATSLLEHVVAIRKIEQNPFDPDLLCSQRDLGRMYSRQWRYEEAIAVLETVLRAEETRHDKITQQDRLLTQRGLAEAYIYSERVHGARRQGDSQRVKDAIRLLEQALSTYDEIVAEDDDDRLRTMHEFAIAYSCDSRPEDAMAVEQAGVAIRSSTRPDVQASRMTPELSLVRALLRARRADEALEVSTHVLEVLQRRRRITRHGKVMIGMVERLVKRAENIKEGLL